MDAVYYLEAVAMCSSDAIESEIIEVTVDRTAPVGLLKKPYNGGVMNFGDDISTSFNEPIKPLNIDDISIINNGTGSAIDFEFGCAETKVVLLPSVSGLNDGDQLEVTISNVTDIYGNVADSFSWSFTIPSVEEALEDPMLDSDKDGIPNSVDICMLTYNPNQEDMDEDGIGDSCDDDIDGDGVFNTIDKCPLFADAEQADTDNDGIGDACDNDTDGDAVFNVPIRTICLRGAKGEMGIGAGITHDSVPIEEWHESLLKGKFLTHSQDSFQLFETIFWKKGSGFYLLELHVARLRRGATFFKFAIRDEEVNKQLQQAAETFSGKCMRVRLVLEKDGRINISAIPCEPPQYTDLPELSEVGDRPIIGSVRFAAYNEHDMGPYLNYKTSRRCDYDKEFKEVLARGDIDALFNNIKGEMTEGCISNIVILKDGVYTTPAITCGLLAGVMREQLFLGANASPALGEAILTREDVQRADAVFICNSVRGVVRVEVAS